VCSFLAHPVCPPLHSILQCTIVCPLDLTDLIDIDSGVKNQWILLRWRPTTTRRRTLPPYLAQQLRPYAHNRALRSTASKLLQTLHTNPGLARALFVCLLPLSGTLCLTAFVSVNVLTLSGNTLKLLIYKRHSLMHPSDPPPQRLWLDTLDFWRLLLIYLVT